MGENGVMNTYIITDTHFGHTQMLDYCNRPYDFERKFYRGLSQLKSNDLLIHLGDVCMGRDGEQHERWIRPLACRTWLIKGNHDRKSIPWYLDHGWDFVSDFPIMVYVGGVPVMLSHHPVSLETEYPYLERTANPITVRPLYNVHGHFHSTDHRKHEPWYNEILTDRHRLVACELDGYQPLKLDKLIGELTKEKL